MRRATCLLAAGAALGLCTPAVAQADPVVDQAVAQFNDLGLTQLTGMPSGRTTYRTYDEYNAEMAALAAANPNLVAIKTAPYKSVQGREVKYLEITNDVNASDGKPVVFHMGAIHGNETPAAEDGIEFAYDVINLSKTNPKVKALLDKVRLIDMPLVNPDGYEYRNAAGTLAPRRASCGPVAAIVPPATCAATGVDLNRNYAFGWGSNIGASFTNRGSGPASEPEVQNTMEIVKRNQVVTLLTGHTNSRALFYPGMEIAAGQTPEKDIYDALGGAMNNAANGWTTNVRDSAHDYETSGETNDWSYYATRGIGITVEWVGGGAGCPQSRPDYLNCTTADFTGTPGPTSSAAQTARFGGKPGRNMLWQALVYGSLTAGHAQIKGSAVPGATLKIAKDFDLYTATVKQNTTPASTTPPEAVPTHLESSIVVGANGQFSWSVNPSTRPVGAYRADGMHPGPNGFYQESWTLTCTAADGTLLATTKVYVDKGDVANITPCTQGSVGGNVPATLSLSLGAPASFGPFTPGLAQDYTASTTGTVISTAGDATLSVADPSATATGHLVNGTFSLPSALQANANGGTYSEVKGDPSTLLTYTGPVSNDNVTLGFKQSIGSSDALRTGTYAKTLTFTLSTTTP
ncbi:MAG TPA: M14 family zinc carboxypeptidase [Solirubrobacter sp.]|nr:M14 family zinc carboxypeptidase [Solirubrobacter sp.]